MLLFHPQFQIQSMETFIPSLHKGAVQVQHNTPVMQQSYTKQNLYYTQRSILLCTLHVRQSRSTTASIDARLSQRGLGTVEVKLSTYWTDFAKLFLSQDQGHYTAQLLRSSFYMQTVSKWTVRSVLVSTHFSVGTFYVVGPKRGTHQGSFQCDFQIVY